MKDRKKQKNEEFLDEDVENNESTTEFLDDEFEDDDSQNKSTN